MAYDTEKIRESLIAQLVANGSDIEAFREQIDSYIWFTVQEHEMREDIRKRGRVYMATTATGKKVEKENPSVDKVLKFSKQRIEILRRLGFSIDSCIAPAEDEDI